MSLSPGSRFGSFEVGTRLGAGGMGEVFRARDTRLNRDVAIKVLPAAFSSDPERRARFQREAQVLASLNHSHIAQIYGFEESASGDVLIMELVEGPTLADRLLAGPLASDEALEIARQIAEALETAHERGIVHRDLKPANIKVREDGTVKILDFGLAKAFGLEPAVAPGELQTISSPAMTERGVILGTVGYMSPEQARGRPVDGRTDIWAFGCVLYEMLTGVRAFAGDTATDVLAAVVNVDPDLSRAPARARRLLRACLQKDPKRRLRDIGDAMSLIDDPGTTANAGAARTSRTLRYAWASLAVVTLATAGLAALHFSERPATRPRMQFEVDVQLTVRNGSFTLSPDGSFLLYPIQLAGAMSHLALRSVETGEVRDLPATENASGGFWSPDSKTIAFVVRGALKAIPVQGGTPTVIAPRGVVGRGCWGRDGFVVMGERGAIAKVPITGGEPVAVTVLDQARGEIHHEQPACLPDGRFLYYRHLAEQGTSGIYLGDPRLPPDRQRMTPVLVAADGPVFVPGPGTSRLDVLFVQDDTLFVQPFDVARAEFVDAPLRVASHVAAGGSGLFSASATGLLAYVNPPTSNRQLTWIDRAGNVGAPVGPMIRLLRGLRVAPSGTRAAIGMFPPEQPVNNDDLWFLPFDGTPLSRFTTEDTVETQPIWSRDGTRLAFLFVGGGSVAIYQRHIDGGAPELVVSVPTSNPVLTDWSPDGRFILFTTTGTNTGSDVWIAPANGADRKSVPVLHGTFNEAAAVLSPDGHVMAYVSNESGRDEVYVRRFEVSSEGVPASPDTGRRLVSAGARGLVRWRRDGRELFYMSADGKLMSVEVTLAPAFSVGTPRALFTFPESYLRANPTGVGFADVTPDGSRWLVAMPPADAPRPALHMLVNWRPPSQ